MGDAAYDAVIIGGGNKGLILGMYLARYGGMSVGIFEKRHEAGGGWSTEEGAAPGFLADYHATGVTAGHQLTTQEDFPEWRELGGELTFPKVAVAGIFKEDDSSIAIYGRRADRTGELTAKSIARFSQRDAETWVKLQDVFDKVIAPYYTEYMFNPPPPLGEPDAMDRMMADPRAGMDPSWVYKTPLEVLRDIFESDEFVAVILRGVFSLLAASSDAGGMGIHVLVNALGLPRNRGVVGGTHSWAHAAVKIFLGDGGKIFNQKEVERVIIENGRASGVILTDGSQVEARRMVISTLDPYSLCFRLAGKEHFDRRTLRRVENLERWIHCITWYTWALREQPHYIAAGDNPDVDGATMIDIIDKDPEALAKIRAMRLLGIMPREKDLDICIFNHNAADKTRAPESGYAVLTEQYVLPGNTLSEDEWLAFKKIHAEDVMSLLGKHTTNVNWDNVIGYIPLTPYDHCRLANMAPTGTWAVVDHGVISQYGRYRPVPELANHRTPVQNLYATGSAWPPFGGSGCWQGYNCYKILAEDFGLRKPWEEQGRPW